jgi:hypothetical protein
MKRHSIIAALSLCYSLATAQSTEQKTMVGRREIMSGAPAIRMLEASKSKDSKVYDINGNVIDYEEVKRLLSTTLLFS